jgi:hypothetical protein
MIFRISCIACLLIHFPLSKANKWCRKGVELLLTSPTLPLDATPQDYGSEIQRLDRFLLAGDSLRLDSLREQTIQSSGDGSPAILNGSEASSLLTQVTERIEDIKRLGLARREAFYRMAGEMQQSQLRRSARPVDASTSGKPVQVVSPEKIKIAAGRKASTATTASTSSASSASSSNRGSPRKVGSSVNC